MKDYIATLTLNGYQSLHTTLIPFLYESMFQLEVQIRTKEMDLIAERGIAAHYSGKYFVASLVGHIMPKGRSSRGKIVCLNNANIAFRVNGNLVSPAHVLANAEVVEIITHNVIDAKIGQQPRHGPSNTPNTSGGTNIGD